eukprot:PhF_6_TR8331/c0_g1_i1/m.13008
MDEDEKQRLAARHEMMVTRMREQRAAMSKWDAECKQKHNELVRGFKANREWEKSIDIKVENMKKAKVEVHRTQLQQNVKEDIESFNDNMRRLGIETKKAAEPATNSSVADVPLDEEALYQRIRTKKNEDIVSRQEKDKRQNKMATDQARLKIMIEAEKKREQLLNKIESLIVPRRNKALSVVLERNMKEAQKTLKADVLEEYSRRSNLAYQKVIASDAINFAEQRSAKEIEEKQMWMDYHDGVQQKQVFKHEDAVRDCGLIVQNVVDLAMKCVTYCYRTQSDGTEVYKSQVIPSSVWRPWMAQFRTCGLDATLSETVNPGASMTQRASLSKGSVRQGMKSFDNSNTVGNLSPIPNEEEDVSGKEREKKLSELLSKEYILSTGSWQDAAPYAMDDCLYHLLCPKKAVDTVESADPYVVVWGKDCTLRTALAHSIQQKMGYMYIGSEDVLQQDMVNDKGDGQSQRPSLANIKQEKKMPDDDVVVELVHTKIAKQKDMVRRTTHASVAPSAPIPQATPNRKDKPSAKEIKEMKDKEKEQQVASPPTPPTTTEPQKPFGVILDDLCHNTYSVLKLIGMESSAHNKSNRDPENGIDIILNYFGKNIHCTPPLFVTQDEIDQLGLTKEQVSMIRWNPAKDEKYTGCSCNKDIYALSVDCPNTIIVQRMFEGEFDAQSGRHFHAEYEPAPPGVRAKKISPATVNINALFNKLCKYDIDHVYLQESLGHNGLTASVPEDSKKELTFQNAATKLEALMTSREQRRKQMCDRETLCQRVLDIRQNESVETRRDEYLSSFRAWREALGQGMVESNKTLREDFVVPVCLLGEDLISFLNSMDSKWENEINLSQNEGDAARKLERTADAFRAEFHQKAKGMEQHVNSICSASIDKVADYFISFVQAELEHWKARELLKATVPIPTIPQLETTCRTPEECFVFVKSLQNVAPDDVYIRIKAIVQRYSREVSFITQSSSSALHRFHDWVGEKYKTLLASIPNSGKIYEGNVTLKDPRSLFTSSEDELPCLVQLSNARKVYGEECPLTLCHIKTLSGALRDASANNGLITREAFQTVCVTLMTKSFNGVFWPEALNDCTFEAFDQAFACLDVRRYGKVNWQELLVCLVFFTPTIGGKQNVFFLPAASTAEMNILHKAVATIAKEGEIHADMFGKLHSVLPAAKSRSVESSQFMINAFWLIFQDHTRKSVNAHIFLSYMSYDNVVVNALQKYCSVTPTLTPEDLQAFLTFNHPEPHKAVACSLDNVKLIFGSDNTKLTFAGIQSSHWGRILLHESIAFTRRVINI